MFLSNPWHRGLVLVCAFVFLTPLIATAAPGPLDSSAELERIRLMQLPTHPAPNPRPDLRDDWAAMIDNVWGSDLSPVDHYYIFNAWLNILDDQYALFRNRDVDIMGLFTDDLTEIDAGVSKGRFQGMLSSLNLAVRNAHTQLNDLEVTLTTPEPGVPLLVAMKYLNNASFGACLTTNESGEVFVYEVIDNHPLGLEVGDVILGYDGRPWRELYEELIAAELPIAGIWLTSQDAYDYSWAIAVGNNWHLFDTVDIRRYGTGEIVSLPTSLLADTTEDLSSYCTDQLNPWLDHPVGPEWVVHDVITVGDRRVGFIGCDAWIDGVETAWAQACLAMVLDPDLDGLIVDFRTNVGGNMALSNTGLSYLFSSTVNTVNFGQRNNPDDHLALFRPYSYTYYSIVGDPGTSFDKPIAVLVGPRAVSSGDQVALRMSLHPQARVFGRPTSCSFDSPTGFPLSGYDNFSGRYSRFDAGPWNHTAEYYSYLGFPVDEEVWLTAEDARRGRDTVIDAALAWICPDVSAAPEPAPAARAGITSVAPNPANPRSLIRFRLPESGSCHLGIYDLAGRLVRSADWSHLEAGSHDFAWDGKTGAGREAASGTYLVRISGRNVVDEARLSLVR